MQWHVPVSRHDYSNKIRLCCNRGGDAFGLKRKELTVTEMKATRYGVSISSCE